MKFEKQKIYIITEKRKVVNHLLYNLTVSFYHSNNKVLFIDTCNSLNPHNLVFNSNDQESIFNNIYCVRTPLPYDLLARLKTTPSFIKKNGINVVIINSLSLFFRDSSFFEIEPLIDNLLCVLREMTVKNSLVTLIGNSPSENKKSMIACGALLERMKGGTR